MSGFGLDCRGFDKGPKHCAASLFILVGRGEKNLDKVNSTLVAFQGLQDLAQRILQSSHLQKYFGH